MDKASVSQHLDVQADSPYAPTPESRATAVQNQHPESPEPVVKWWQVWKSPKSQTQGPQPQEQQEQSPKLREQPLSSQERTELMMLMQHNADVHKRAMQEQSARHKTHLAAVTGLSVWRHKLRHSRENSLQRELEHREETVEQLQRQLASFEAMKCELVEAKSLRKETDELIAFLHQREESRQLCKACRPCPAHSGRPTSSSITGLRIRERLFGSRGH